MRNLTIPGAPPGEEDRRPRVPDLCWLAAVVGTGAIVPALPLIPMPVVWPVTGWVSPAELAGSSLAIVYATGWWFLPRRPISAHEER